ncbi:MAG: penicillin-binding transpeptidase domain-containing protein [Anaerolineae bacterium]|nr:penicillin-binding transpeptidase domain-containing protein [Anaerolineae bacterium]
MPYPPRAVFIALLMVLSAVLGACQPAPPQSVEPLPTLFPSPTPPGFNIDGAERVAGEFLYGWQTADYAAMYALINFTSREATPFEQFTAFYEASAATLSLEQVSAQIRALARDPVAPRVANLTYDATFQTRLVGSFTDSARQMTLVFDERDSNWRVAWSRGDFFRELENGGRMRLVTTPVNRANIYDRDGVVLAMQDERLIITVQVVRMDIPDEAACLARIVEASNLTLEQLQTRLNSQPSDWVNELAIIEPQAYQQYGSALETDCAAEFGTRPARHYPNGSLMPHIIGSVGYLDAADLPAVTSEGFQQDAILGRSGIERQWDSYLRGVPRAQLVIEDTSGVQRRLLAERAAEPAQAVWLTIDSDLQQRVLDILSNAYAQNAEGWGQRSRGAAAIIMDVQTGAILAMVSYPTYDGNAFTPFPVMGREAAQDIIAKTGTDERLPLLNRATQGRYPSGSVMKIAVSLAVAESGVYSTNQRYSCAGVWNRDGVTRTDWLPSGHGTQDLAGAITNSCNPYYYEVGYQMNLVDPYLLPRYLRQFGMGVPTGLTDIPEDPGNIGDPDSYRIKTGIPWSFVDAVSMSIGQGEVEVTPLQIVRLTAAVANGGVLWQPYLVEKAGLFNDFVYTAEPNPLSNINVRSEVLDTIRRGMCEVTTGFTGTATYVFEGSPLLTLGVCGKTGTAQNLPGPTTHAWFAAYAPRIDPEIAVVVIVEDAGEGSGTAAPLVREMMEYYFFGGNNE